jgi:hypothetical protein
MPDDAKNEEWKRHLDTLTKMQLREQYPKEAIRHRGMKDRCKNPRGQEPLSYDPVFEEFIDFLKYMGPVTSPDDTIDRIDNHNRRYEPGNVRWLDKEGQTRNRANTVAVELFGKVLTVKELSDEYGIPASTIYSAVVRGEPVEKVIVRAGHREKNAAKREAVLAFSHPDPNKDGPFQDAFRRWRARLKPSYRDFGQPDVYFCLRITEQREQAAKVMIKNQNFGPEEEPPLDYADAELEWARTDKLWKYAMANIEARDPVLAKRLRPLTGVACTDLLAKAIYTPQQLKDMKSARRNSSGHAYGDDDADDGYGDGGDDDEPEAEAAPARPTFRIREDWEETVQPRQPRRTYSFDD